MRRAPGQQFHFDKISDLNTMQDLGRERYDLVVVFFFLQRELFPALISAIKPGGILIYKTYTTEQKNFAGGPSHPMFLLEPNELVARVLIATCAALSRDHCTEGRGGISGEEIALSSQ